MNNLDLLLTGPLVPRQRNEVPEFLQDGSLYKTHLDEVFPIMGLLQCMKFTRNVTDNESCFSMLCTLRHWGVKNLPHELMTYILSEDLVWEDYNVMELLLLELPSVRLLLELKELPEGIWLEYAMQEGDLQVVQHLVEREGHTWSKRCATAAIQNNQLECLQYAVANGCTLAANACELAARDGHMNCLVYLHSQKQPFGPNISVEAVRGGVLQSSYLETRILEYVYNNGGTITEAAFLEALKLGNLPILKYLVQHNCVCDASTAYKTACKYGQLASLQFLHENGFIWDERVVHMLCRRLVKCAVSSPRRQQYESCLHYCVKHRCPFDWHYIERCQQARSDTSECLQRIFQPALESVQLDNICKLAGVAFVSCLLVIMTAENPVVAADNKCALYVKSFCKVVSTYEGKDKRMSQLLCSL
eukprot:gene17299-19718_t